MAVSAEESHQTKGLLRLTMACNERCSFCNVPVEDYLPQPTPTEALIQGELDAFVATGAKTLTLSGGEPTLRRKQLLALAHQARDRGIPFIELQTNAVLIDAQFAEELAQAGITSAFISLLSDLPEHHDKLTDFKDAHVRCLRGIDALIANGIRVTLNPVIAAPTVDRVAHYVQFVADRLPGVRCISLSAVQPHGRAAENVHLIPDYARLAPSILAAKGIADQRDIELVNPYCGVPVCVGWNEDLARCVEATEAQSGGWQPTLGIENTGDKRHGEPCLDCALRTRCGGAWHKYWEVHGGSGLSAPLTVVDPWQGTADHQMIVSAGEVENAWAALDGASADAFVVWLKCTELVDGDALKLMQSRCTDVALITDLKDPLVLREVRRLEALSSPAPGPQQVRVWLGIPGTTARSVWDTLVLAYALGLHRARILASPSPKWNRLLQTARAEFPELDVQLRSN